MKIKFQYQLTLISLMLLSSFQLLAQDKFGGLALYTVREDMALDPESTLQNVADIGYQYVEAAGYKDRKFYGMEPVEFKNYLKEVGLIPLSSHQSTVTLENADEMIADVKAAGFEYFVVPIPPMGLYIKDPDTKERGFTGGAANLAAILDILGEKCYKAGLKLLYHNHDFEFKKDTDGIVPIEYLLENCNPKYVNFQMDLFWVSKVGVDPVVYFKKYPGRFKLWHVKDMDLEGNFAPVGSGTIDFTRILEQKSLSGMEYYYVEQDTTFHEKPIEAIKISHEGLKKIGFDKVQKL